MKITNFNNLRNFKTKILLGCISLSVTSISPCFAQSNIAPDNTLGNEPSKVNNNVNNLDGIPSELIEGGAQRGQNLFHSLQEFNVDEGRGAYFVAPNDIQNILTRVTGNNASQINGILGTILNRNFDQTNANLFLINPNGIIFGRNASLDVNGSFVGTTANGIEFGERGLFSATNPEAPSGLLIVNPNAFLFSQVKQRAEIRNNSVVESGRNPAGEDASGLRVPDGKSLLLLGGNVSMDGGELNAFGGRVELGGLTEPGTVALDINGDNFSLGFPEDVTRGDVSLTNQAFVFVEAGGGGDIAVNARNVDITGGSRLSAGIGEDLGTPETVAGDITLDATGKITVAGSASRIFNLVRSQSTGNGGNIDINTNELFVTDGAQLLTRTFGKGNAGSVTINASDTVFLTGFEGNAQPTIGSDVVGGSSGNGNDIKIKARSIILDNKAIAAASILNGKGENGNPAQAGNVIFEASEQVSIDNSSRVYSEVGRESFGNGGSVNIKAPEVVLNNRAFLNTQVQENGEGKAGDINIIETGKLSVNGGSGLYATTSGQGNAGSIKIDTTNSVTFDRGEAFSWVNGKAKGDGGNINIDTGTLSVKNKAQLLTRTYGKGNAGSVTINANDTVFLTGFEGNEQPTIGSDVVGGSSGNGNDIKIKARSIILDNKAIAAASILNGKGENGNPAQAGNVIFEASEQVTIDNSSRVYSEVGSQSFGNGGSINIKAPEVVLNNRASLITQIRGNGEGKAGDINIIETGRLSVTGGSGLYATTRGQGDAGKITVNVKDNFNADNGKVITSSERTNGGNIEITAKNIILRNDSDINTTLQSTQGTGGNITLSANAIVALEDSDILAFAAEGRGGNITFNTDAFLSDPLFRPRPQDADPLTAEELDDLDGNNRVDVDASGSIRSGTVSGQTDARFLEDSLIELPRNQIDTEALIAQTCVVRSKQRNGTFYIIGSGGLPYRPGDLVPSKYPAIEVQPVPDEINLTKPRRWKIGDPIVEPNGVYTLEDGRRILSRECGT